MGMSETLKAISDPARREILEMLKETEKEEIYSREGEKNEVYSKSK